MSKSISSLPAAAKFRSTLVIIIVLICISVFLTFTRSLSEKAELIARDRVISDIRYSLAMMLYDYTIKGKSHELEKFDMENPFVALAIYRSLPGNYKGVVDKLSSNNSAGWYYENTSKLAVYIGNLEKRKAFMVSYQEGEVDKVGALKFIEMRGNR